MIDTDVANLSRWGRIFDSSAPWFHGPFENDPEESEQSQNMRNTWNYIEAFSRDSDTPIFWETWDTLTIYRDVEWSSEFLHSMRESRYPNREPLADWEWEAMQLAPPPIFSRVCAEHGMNPYDPYDTGI